MALGGGVLPPLVVVVVVVVLVVVVVVLLLLLVSSTSSPPSQLLFHNVPRVSMALASQLAMLNTQRPAGERAKRSKLAKEMVSWVQLPLATG